MHVLLTYKVSGSLTQTLLVATELQSEFGFTPEFIEFDGKKLRYVPDDVNDLLTNRIPEDEYIKMNLML